MTLQQLSPHLYRFADTCNVFALRQDDRAMLIDFGSGAILAPLAAAGVTQVSDVLMTHHHRDQAQGLATTATDDIAIWVPHSEQHLFQDVDAHWQARPIMNDYNMRQDRFSLLQPVPVAGTLRDYARMQFGARQVTVWPTPGHTTGSVTLLTDVDGRRVAFSGDLIAAPGEVWSLAATQWSYNGAEGVAATILSLLSLKEQLPDLLLPSHGEPITEVDGAIDLLVERLWQLLQERDQNRRLFQLRGQPYEALTPHLLRNRTSVANSYVLRAADGAALLFDFGYDFVVGDAVGADRASRRPWLYTIETLKRQHDITQIEIVVPTHFHDDHVAGINLLRDVEGAELWAAENFAPILENPWRYDLPCLWYDAIPVDRTLPLQQPIRWRDYEFTLHPLPGHTRYAVAIDLQVDGTRVLVSGDQYQGEDGLQWNYVYHNGFQIEDYEASAALYGRLAPDLILSGHWQPLWVQEGYFQALAERGQILARLHRQLLPQPVRNVGAEGFAATLRPYQSSAVAGQPHRLEVAVRNPLSRDARTEVSLVAPVGWRVLPPQVDVQLPAASSAQLSFTLIPPLGLAAKRARVAADVSFDDQPWGQQAEALVNVRHSEAQE